MNKCIIRNIEYHTYNIRYKQYPQKSIKLKSLILKVIPSVYLISWGYFILQLSFPRNDQVIPSACSVINSSHPPVQFWYYSFFWSCYTSSSHTLRAYWYFSFDLSFLRIFFTWSSWNLVTIKVSGNWF